MWTLLLIFTGSFWLPSNDYIIRKFDNKEDCEKVASYYMKNADEKHIYVCLNSIKE